MQAGRQQCPPRAAWFRREIPKTQAVQLMRDLRQEEFRASVQIVDAARWLAELAA
jgi:hypothetical protein